MYFDNTYYVHKYTHTHIVYTVLYLNILRLINRRNTWFYYLENKIIDKICNIGRKFCLLILFPILKQRMV